MPEHGCRTPEALSSAPPPLPSSRALFTLSLSTHGVPGASDTGNGQDPAWTAGHRGPARQHGVDQESRVRIPPPLTSLPFYFQGAANTAPQHIQSLLSPLGELLCLQRLEWYRGRSQKRALLGKEKLISRSMECQLGQLRGKLWSQSGPDALGTLIRQPDCSFS